jgi:predicted methyltransferase
MNRLRSATRLLTFTPIGVLSVLPAVFLTACAGSGAPAQNPAPMAITTTTSAAPAMSSSTEAKLRAAIAGAPRTDKERARDTYRHPYETLAFFGVHEDSKVIELWPGGGYYTAILAPLVRDNGHLAVTHFDLAGDPKAEDTQEAHTIVDRLAKTPATFDRVGKQQVGKPNFDLGPDGSADVVLTFRNLHNWLTDGYADKVLASAFRALRSGGVLGVEEHRGRPGMSRKEIDDSGYVPEDVVIQLAQAAGFRLDGRSEVNANPKDTKDYKDGVWSLPPVLAEKDVNREKYLAIGESDRMTLRFVKP